MTVALNNKSVSASAFYFSPPEDGSHPHIYTEPREGVPYKNYGQEEHTVQFEDVRGKEDSYSLDKTGFYFGKHAANHKSFNNDEEIKKEYYAESAELLKRVTGASKVVFFDHTLRRRQGEPGLEADKRGPVPMVHVDQSSSASHNRVRRHLPEAEAEERLKRRFQIINLWRPISHPAFDWPLALCDFYSVDREKDLTPVDLIYPDKVGQTLGVRYNPQHRWKYLKGMTPEEFVLIKCYDSIEDGSVAVLTPHTAFNDPSTPAGSLPRQSIELRALIFYD
ncbi:hypothetical protein AAF712_003316 [Marasmius tenuissimus]|uniref:Methyltransferase n=1 Tax=Marasmius tenuissimus TaxID=585030 RepID=A0ABR3A7K1_9AGAR|nr:hypothetical protein PM082_012168 [Marasmius tenuissimus]